MKLQIVSDLHLEFNDNIRINNAGADVLVLAGDICVVEHLRRNPPEIHGDVNDLNDIIISDKGYASYARRYRNFFDQVSKEFDTVVYVAGNHEHYHGLWNNTIANLRDALEPWNNIILMDDRWINLQGIRIIGTSLWTDLDNRNPLTMAAIKQGMSDYHVITINNSGAYHKLRPIDTATANIAAVATIKEGVSTWDGPVIVVGHHAPSNQSIHPRFASQWPMNAAFVNNLDEYIIDHPQIKMWIHGHVHDRWDYMIGDTRIICNPHGYPDEPRVWDPNLVIEIQGE